MTAFNRNLLWFLGLTLVAATFYYFSDIVTYILVAWVLSMLGKPLMDFFQKRLKIGKFHAGPTAAALLTILSFFAILVGILMVFVPTIIHQAQNLSQVDYQALGEKLKGPFFDLDAQLHKIGLLKPEESLAMRTQEALKTVFKPTLLGDFVSSFFAIAGNVVVTLTAVTFILFFFLQDDKMFLDILHTIAPDGLEEKVERAVQESSEMLSRYFGGLLTQVAAFSITVSIILWMLGVNNALLIGAFGGIFNIIPYIGPILGMVFGLFLTLSSHLDLDFAMMLPLLLKVAAAFGATQFIDNNFVGPMIFSKSVQAHPLEIFIVTLVAAKIGGVVGMVIGIPVYTVLRVIGRVFFSHLKVVQRLTVHLDETITLEVKEDAPPNTNN